MRAPGGRRGVLHGSSLRLLPAKRQGLRDVPPAPDRRRVVRVGRELDLPRCLGAGTAAIAATARDATATAAAAASRAAAIEAVRSVVWRLPRAALLRAAQRTVLQTGGQGVGAVQAADASFVPIEPAVAVPVRLARLSATSTAAAAAASTPTARVILAPTSPAAAAAIEGAASAAAAPPTTDASALGPACCALPRPAGR